MKNLIALLKVFLDCGIPLIDWIFPKNFITQNKKEISLITECQYHNSKYKSSHKNLLSFKISHTWVQNRREDVLCFCFLSRMCITQNILFHFPLTDTQTQQLLSSSWYMIDHIILSCNSKYCHQRHYCFANLSSNSPCFANLTIFTEEFCSSPAFHFATIKYFKLVGCS